MLFNRKTFFVIIALLMLLAGCAPEGSPEGVVADYIRAKVDLDADKMRALSCAAWEADAQLEYESFETLAPELEDLKCEKSGESGDYALVTCTGAITATYQGETRAVDLGERVYRALQEDGAWKMCGYKD
jgi:hypothetical protein